MSLDGLSGGVFFVRKMSFLGGSYIMKQTEKTVNQITEGIIWKQLLYFFFPILLGTFFQQLYNTADAWWWAGLSERGSGLRGRLFQPDH